MNTNTVPNKIPKLFLRGLKEDKYDNIILFTLSVFGPHKLKEFINDPAKNIENRLDKEIFQKWANELIESNFIEEFKEKNEIIYRITSKGSDAFFNRLESDKNYSKLINRLQKYFEGIITTPNLPKSNIEDNKIKSESISGYKISLKEYIFGLLSIKWRFNEFRTAGGKTTANNPDDKMSLGQFLDANTEKFADKTALLYKDLSFTHQEQNDLMNKYANYFLSIGLKKGDVINVILENRPELIFIIGAMTKSGIIASLINTNQRSVSLVHSLKLLKVKAWIIGEELFNNFEEVKPDLGLTDEDKLYFLEDTGKMGLPEGYIDLKSEIKNQDTSTPDEINDIIGKDPFCYIFTSGTTGLPKAVPMRHIHTINSSYSWGTMAMNMQPDDIIYIVLPFNHSNAINLGWASSIRGGGAIALTRKFSASNFWNDIKKYGATCFNYIGELCRYLLNNPPNSEDKNHNVYKILGNGLIPDLWVEFKERFGIKEVYEHFGQTELRSMFCNYINRDCTIGINLEPYAIVKYDIDNDVPVRDENGFLQEVEMGDAGLLLVKIQDDTTFAGYTNKIATEQKIFRNAFGIGEMWLNTGDLIRNIGYFHAQFVDRLGDTFRWKGENVSTSEVEGVLSSFKQINHSSVYGVEIPGTEGRAGMLSILIEEDVDVDLDGIYTLLRKNLPKYAIPLFIRILSELSTTVTFKIKKSDMKKVGFNIHETQDTMFVLLPGSSKYTPLTDEIYDKIINKEYRF
ncbi:MAG: long-chain-acyl-CoA synthetase [archaeon]|nr:long-chain-acyl-CoA synthetase [archaeon]